MATRRLYVGGLGHSVTQKDLKDRFGKFGDVEEVELLTRRDEQGIPFKTFGYVSINISESDLKKCLTVLNKSRWKGGTLQIETAKESFLHRLAQERQEAQQSVQPAALQQEKLLETLRSVGVENFHMKAAVPGTEVPGHKNWVVSKFGRVLPVLQLRQRGGRTLKYDPSKHSHNIRRLAPPTEAPPTPISQLTWEIQGGDDDISKKRRGEFPPCKPWRPKRSRTEPVGSHDAEGHARSDWTERQWNRVELTNGVSRPQRNEVRLIDSDLDSDEEIRRLVSAQRSSQGALGQEVEEDNLEVVGDDFLLISRRFHLQQKGRRADEDEEEEDRDSADTDELLASRRPSGQRAEDSGKQSLQAEENMKETDAKKGQKKKKKTVLPVIKPPSSESDSDDEDDDDEEGLMSRCAADRAKRKKQVKQTVVPVKPPASESDGDEEEEDEDDEDDEEEDDDDDEELESADSGSDSDYEAMFSNCTRLEISLADLQKLAEEDDPTLTAAPSMPGAAQPGSNGPAPSKTTQLPVPKKGTTPEEILAAILDGDSSEDESKKKKKKKRKSIVSTPLPAFQGTGALTERTGTDERETRREEEEGESATKKQRLDSEDLQLKRKTKPGADDMQRHTKPQKKTNEEEEEEPQPKVASSSSSSSSEEEEEETVLPPDCVRAADQTPRAAAPPDDYDSSSSSSEEEEQEARSRAGPPEDEEELQRKANLRRLAAVEQRRRETEEHRKLIQGALSNLDAPSAGRGKHIVFGSDDDDEDQQTTSEVMTSKKTQPHDSQSDDEASGEEAGPTNQKKPAGSQLFSSSEDEDGGDEEDDSRFQIRQQYEGRAGQKLMELQSRFGTDERFRMDSRFLDSDEDEEEKASERKRSEEEEDEGLEEERRKNLSILQRVLGSSTHTLTQSSGKSSKAAKFRDVSALHYDPSREEHAAFETKTEETKKESKASRRKKREEAEKLPEVSKEIYYDVTANLKAVFGLGQTKDAEGEKKASWDQEEGEEEEEGGRREEEQTSLLADGSTATEEPGGFKFSFFGDETETGSKETAEYQVETIQGPRVSWQQDPRFHDSSSEEEEEEEDEKEEEQEQSSSTKTTEEKAPSKTDFFFFYPKDERLTEGPRFFCRSGQLEEQREQWEERRSVLRQFRSTSSILEKKVLVKQEGAEGSSQEYRKKHRDAKRRLKTSQRS